MFNLNFSLYPYILLFSLILNILFVFIVSSKYKLKLDETLVALLYENIGFLFGCKIHAAFIKKEILTLSNFYYIGFSSLGGLFLAIINLIIFSIQYKIDLKKIMYVFIPITPLLYSIGKIACFIEGCCYGIPYDGLFAVYYPYSSAPKVSLFPIQLVESIIFLIIFIFMYRNTLKERQNLKSLGYGFISIGIAKFLLDFFRYSHINVTISSNQCLCFIFILVGLLCIYFNDKNSEKRNIK